MGWVRGEQHGKRVYKMGKGRTMWERGVQDGSKVYETERSPQDE